jgi:LPS export ABC transporter protein LptC
VAVAVLWQREPAGPKDAGAEGPTIDAEAWEVRLRQREAGGESWELTAEHAAHYPAEGVTRLRAVHLVLERGDGPPITARARKGRVRDADNRVTLEGDVTLEDPEGYRMTTATLHYLPAAGRAETDDPVRIEAGFGEVTGVGATVWTEEQRLRLHRQVRTTVWKDPRDAS